MQKSESLKTSNNNLFYCILLAVLTLISVFVTYKLSSGITISFDTSYQYFLNEKDWGSLMPLIVKDYSPPLYTFILKIYSTFFGADMSVLRFFYAIPLFGMLSLILFPLRKLIGGKAAIIAAVLTTFSSINFFFFDDIRPTLLGVFTATGCNVFALACYRENKKRDYIGLSIFTVLSMYSHTIAMLVAAGAFLTLLILFGFKKNFNGIKRVLISGGICSLIYIPWLIILVQQLNKVQTHYWHSPEGAGKVLSDYVIRAPFEQYSGLDFLTLIICLVIFFSLMIPLLLIVFDRKTDTATVIKEKYKDSGLFLLMFAIELSIGLFFILYLRIATARYFYIYSVSFLILLAVLFAASDKKNIISILLITLVSVNYISNVRGIYIYVKLNEDKIGNLIAIIEDDAESTPYILHTSDAAFGVFKYYMPEANHMIGPNTATVLQTFDVYDANTIFFESEFLEEHDVLYIALADTNLRYTIDYDIEEIHKSLEARNDSLTYEVEYLGGAFQEGYYRTNHLDFTVFKVTITDPAQA